MKLIVQSTSARVAMQVGIAATISGATVELQATPAEFAAALHQDAASLGLFYREDWPEAVVAANELRRAGVLNLLFCVVDTLKRDWRAMASARARILAAGADDVQSWPVDPQEIAGRLHALQRRIRPPAELVFIPPAGRFDPVNQTVVGDGVVIHLTVKESALLEILAFRAGSCLSKAACMRAMYGERDEPETKILDVFLCKLRRKLRPICGDYDPIETVWGQGLRFRDWSAAA